MGQAQSIHQGPPPRLQKQIKSSQGARIPTTSDTPYEHYNSWEDAFNVPFTQTRVQQTYGREISQQFKIQQKNGPGGYGAPLTPPRTTQNDWQNYFGLLEGTTLPVIEHFYANSPGCSDCQSCSCNPVNCQGVWLPPSACDRGYKTITFKITQHAMYGGTSCPVPDGEVRYASCESPPFSCPQAYFNQDGSPTNEWNLELLNTCVRCPDNMISAAGASSCTPCPSGQKAKYSLTEPPKCVPE